MPAKALADKILHRYRAFGPRGMAMAPTEEAARLEGIDLPDAELWDRLHAFDGALQRHCRDEARRILDQFHAEAPTHRVTRDARLRLAVYDANTAERLEAVESLLEIADDDPCLQLDRLGCLRGLSSARSGWRSTSGFVRTAIRTRSFCNNMPTNCGPTPGSCRRPRGWPRRAVRFSPAEGGSYAMLANVYWDQGRFAEGLELYRFAACLNDKDENFAHSYFVAAQWFKKTEEVLQFLRARFARFGAKSWLPARTLITALVHLNRSAEAIEVIEKALALRSEDAEMALFAAKTYASFGGPHLARAKGLLAEVEPKAPRGQWLRTAAQLAEMEGAGPGLGSVARTAVHATPGGRRAWRRGDPACRTAGPPRRPGPPATGRGAVSALPAVGAVVAQRLHDEPATVREPVLRRLLEAIPDDAWLHRELGFLLAGQRRFAEAWQEAEISLRLEPREGPTHHLRAVLFRGEGRIPEAKEALRQALLQSIDNVYAAHELMALCNSLDERRETLDLIREELKRQVIFGDGLLTFRELAHGTLDAAELLAVLQEAVSVRPDLWHAWSAVALQLMNMGQVDEAWATIRKATERYPLLPRPWLDQATIARARGDDREEQQALTTACDINPQWGLAVRSLCSFHERQGDLQASAPASGATRRVHAVGCRQPGHVGRSALASGRAGSGDPTRPPRRRVRAGIHARVGLPERLDPRNELPRRGPGNGPRADATARRRGPLLARRGPGLQPARGTRCPPGGARQGPALNPGCVDAFDLRARSLAAAGRWDEAYAACRPKVFGDKPPAELRARGAWLAAEQGDRQRAIAEMRQVVAESPAMFDAWSSLHQWCNESKDVQGSLAAAEAMVRISPQYQFGYGCLGEARRMGKDRAGAIEAFGRALELNPEYEFAGVVLFDLHLEQNDLKSAAATLDIVRKHVQTAYVLARAVQLAVRQRNYQAACEAFRQVCVTACASPWPVNAAVDAMLKAGWIRDVGKVLREAVDRDGVHPEVACRWARVCAAADDLGFEQWIGASARKAGGPIMPLMPILKPWPRPAKAGLSTASWPTTARG